MSSTAGRWLTGQDEGGADPADGNDPVHALVHVSRLLGQDPSLVLHGGGNSSLKLGELIRVKASGHDMRTIDTAGLPGLRREALHELASRESLSDLEMMEGYRDAAVDPGSPRATIEALVHNLIPERSVLHTHADAIVALTNTVDAEAIVRDALGPDVLLLPFVMPGFDLARRIRRELDARGGKLPAAIVLRHHGLFTWGDSPRSAYELHIRLVEAAEQYIHDRTGVLFAEDHSDSREVVGPALSPMVRDLLASAGTLKGGKVHAVRVNGPEVTRFLEDDALLAATQRGTASLEHVIHTKRLPLLGTDVDSYAEDYRDYFRRNARGTERELTMLDPVPRVVLPDGSGIIALGRDRRRAEIAADIYRHTMRVIEASEALGGYETVTEAQSFAIEYWELEQAKLQG